MTLKDFAYNEGTTNPYRICIEENGEPASYLVLTDDYNGNCLLLREYILEERRIYNVASEYRAYYEGSTIDKYLSNEFINVVDREVRSKIPETEIVITATESLGFGGDAITSIIREVFLLSYTELNIFDEFSLKEGGYRTLLKEGEPLRYFTNDDSRIAYDAPDHPNSWMLRTATTSDVSLICIVSNKGYIAIGGVSSIIGRGEDMGELIGVRPAFCLPGDLKAKALMDENGEKYYVLDKK